MLRICFFILVMACSFTSFAQHANRDAKDSTHLELLCDALQADNDSVILSFLDTVSLISRGLFAYAHFNIARININILDREITKNKLLSEEVIKARVDTAACHYKIAMDSVYRAEDKIEILTDEILAYYSYDYARYKQATDALAKRIEQLKVLEVEDPKRFKEEYDFLKKIGYRKNKTGAGFGLQLTQGKNTWLGGELAFVSEKKMNKPHSLVKREVESVNGWGQFFIVGFHKSMQTDTREFTFSPVQMTLPVALNLFKTGLSIDSRDTKKHFFYRPEIGFGWRSLSLHYAYTAYFSKPLEVPREKHQIGLKLMLHLGKED